MNTITILIRPTLDGLTEEAQNEIGNAEACDDVVLFEQGLQTSPMEVEEGETFEIDHGYEGSIATQEDGAKVPVILDSDGAQNREDWALTSGTWQLYGNNIRRA